MQKRSKLSKVDKKILFGLVTKTPLKIMKKEKTRKQLQLQESKMCEVTR